MAAIGAVRHLWRWAAFAILGMLVACGGGGDGRSKTTPTFSLGGTVVGLNGGQQVILLNGAGGQTTLRANGTFRFPEFVPQGVAYNLSVFEHPLGQTCLIQNGTNSSGPTNDVSNISVVCQDNTLTVGGTVSGLPVGSTVTVNNGPFSSLSISGNGGFILPIKLAPTNTYAVSVTAQPVGASCGVTNGTGTIVNSSITNVSVQCTRANLTVSGDLAGLAQGQSIKLRLESLGMSPLTQTLSASGPFTLGSAIAYGNNYAVFVDTQPTGQSCSVSNASATSVVSPVVGVRVVCSSFRYALGGLVTGLAPSPGGRPLVLRNGTEALSVSSGGVFRFQEALAHGSGYSVTIGSQPTGQTCSVINGAGSQITTDVSNVSVQCLSFVWRSRLIAGSGIQGTTDEVGPQASFAGPSGVALTPQGDLIITDTSTSRIRRVLLPPAVVGTIAGTALPGLQDNASALLASFRGPMGVVVDPQGHIFIADTGNHVIRRLDASTRAVQTYAGTGVPGYREGPANTAQFNSPRGLTLDSAGNLYVADTGNHVIRKIAPNGTVSLLAGASGSRGNTDGTGSSATFDGPTGVAADPLGNVYVADTQNSSIRVITAAAQVITLAGGGGAGFKDGPGAFAAFNLPTGIAVDASAGVFVADTGNHAIRHVLVNVTTGHVLTIAGSGVAGSNDGVGAEVLLHQPMGVAVDSAGGLVITESAGHRVRGLSRSPN